MLDKKFSTRFKKDLKKYQHNKEVIKEFNDVLKLLLSKTTLPEKYKDHNLTSNLRPTENATSSQMYC